MSIVSQQIAKCRIEIEDATFYHRMTKKKLANLRKELRIVKSLKRIATDEAALGWLSKRLNSIDFDIQSAIQKRDSFESTITYNKELIGAIKNV